MPSRQGRKLRGYLAFASRSAAEIARPRFLSPAVLRQIGVQIRAKTSPDDAAIANLLSLIEDVARRVDLGCRVIGHDTAGVRDADCRNRAGRFGGAARIAISAQLNRFSRFLASAPPDIRRDWEEYLLWNETNRLASPEVLTTDQLDRLETRWANAVLALDNASLVTTSLAVQRFIQLQRRATSQRTAGDWAGLLGEAADRAERHSQGDSPDERLVRIVIELERNGVAAELGNAVRRRYSHPNAVLVVSTKNLKKETNVPFDEGFRVNGVFGGVYSRGEGRLTGTFACDPLPSPSVARWMWRIDAVSQLRSSGTSQGVNVSSQGVTKVRGYKRFEWGLAGIGCDCGGSGCLGRRRS